MPCSKKVIIIIICYHNPAWCTYEHTLILEHLKETLYIVLMYLKAEFDLSTLAHVPGMTKKYFKNSHCIRRYFSLIAEMVWYRDLFSFAQYCFHSFNSC